MAMLKFGDTFNQGVKKEIYLVGGRAIKDAETKEIKGKALSSVSVVGNETATDTTFLSLECWGKLSSTIANVKKGDYVLAFGILKSREYNDKTYYSIDCSWALANEPITNPMPRPKETPTETSSTGTSGSDFQVLSGDLPF